jgi:enamine deaminase RidA (YjgF/YER057c/UK114 family)
MQSKIGASHMKRFLAVLLMVSGTGAGLWVARGSASALPQAAPSFSIQYLEGTQQHKDRATSLAVITQGGKMIWLAGQSGGGSPGNFEGQARSVFANMKLTLERGGASLKDVVFLKVFMKSDPSNGAALTRILEELFADGKYPASSVVTVAYAGSLIEIQGVAVVPE